MDGLLQGQQRGQYVARMFGRIAARYDLLNRFMSLGQDQRWRRRMAALAEVPAQGLVLDLATGTGDVALAVLERSPDAQVVGADFALPMMQVGQRKQMGEQGLSFVGADALALPFHNMQFDALLHAFLMRNIADIASGFREQWRVLKPGGRVVCLEIVGPEASLIRSVYHLFFETIVPRVGALISGDAQAYSYLPQSVLRFPAPDTLSQMMREAGFAQVRYERVMLGTIAIHVGEKPRAS
ncbi:MAG: ubiquinone/menaquinone biosynthesis methyltransferase [Ardenticatenales bacterium]|nr:ubiquinone/menaquinone biosynthesis methyltransferase [Ardenticatenales bacterium]